MQTAIYDLLNRSLEVDVYISGAVSSAPSLVVEFPNNTGERTLDNRERSNYSVTIRIHTLHPPNAINTREANEIKTAVRTVMEDKPVIAKQEVYTGRPNITNQTYEYEGKKAYDILLSYDIRITQDVLNDWYFPERLLSNWVYLIGSEAPTDIITVDDTNKSTFFNGNEFLIDESFENQLFIFDDNELSLNDEPIFVNLPDNFPQRWKMFMLTINGNRNIEFFNDNIYPQSEEFDNKVVAIPGHLVSPLEVKDKDGDSLWVVVGNSLPKEL